jgi:4-amino-4-deoxy-L-arabinose transferase-like glycosyltransferase
MDGRASPWVRWPILVGLYLASRLAALSALPMFLDERIHLRWAYWIAQGRRLRLPFISGRGLSVYLLAAVAPESPDPLQAGRLLTVAAGLGAMIACHRLAWRATRESRAADLAALFYIACPFTLFHDRMVLTDSFLAAFTALVLVLSLALAEAPRLRTAVGLGFAIGLGVVSKTTGLVLFAVPALAVALLSRPARRALGPLAAAYAIAAAVAAYPLWLFFRKTDELSGAMGVRDNESSFAGNAGANLRLALEWLWAYWTPGLALLALAGLAFALARRDRGPAAALLALVAFAPTIAFVAVSEIWYPRYLLFTTVPLLPLAAWGFVAIVDAVRARAALGRAATAALTVALLAAVLVPALRFDLALWSDPARAPFPALDRFQYVTGWPSGYGARESMAFLRGERERHPGGLLLVTPGPSTTASAVRLLSGRDPGVEVRYVDPATLEDLRGLARSESPRAVFVIVSRAESVRLPPLWAPALARAFASFKPDGAAADEIYRACPTAGCP